MKLDELLNEGGWSSRKHKTKTFYLKNRDKAEFRLYVVCKYGYPEYCEAYVIPKTGQFVGNSDFDYAGSHELTLHFYDNPADLEKFFRVVTAKLSLVDIEGRSAREIADEMGKLVYEIGSDFFEK